MNLIRILRFRESPSGWNKNLHVPDYMTRVLGDYKYKSLYYKKQ